MRKVVSTELTNSNIAKIIELLAETPRKLKSAYKFDPYGKGIDFRLDLPYTDI